MDGGTGPGAELLSPAETEWPPELRLPPPPSLTAHHGSAPQVQPKQEPPPPPRHAQGFEDQQHFLGSIMGAAAQPQPQPQQAAAAAPEALVKRKRGRPRKNPDGAAAAAAAAAPARPTPATKDEEVVCFICFDGGNLVVCDRRGCPKVYHPACIKRDESFFKARVKWDCGWHICSICEKAAHYMCYTCTYSLCKGCITKGDFFAVRGNKGFCDTCYGTILLIESQDECGSKIKVDFDDKTSWEYLFKLYWLDQKGKHLLTLEELISAKSRWIVPTTASRREKSESSDELYHANNDQDASFDISSRKRRQSNSCGRRGRKRQKDAGVTARKHEISFKGYESLPNRLPTKGMVLQGDTKWASPELLEFIGHVRNGDNSYISQHDVHILLLEYIKQNNLRDPRKRSQVICDARLNNLFRKPRVAHFEMLKLLEMHFHVKENPAVNADSNPDSAQLDSDKRRKIHKINQELTANPEDYAAIDMHNINLIYLRRSLMEDLIDDKAAFSDKIAGAFVRIRISGLGQKQDMYRLVKVLGTHKVTEQYSVGKKTTDYALEILNLDKKEIITMDTISNQDFTEEECKRLRQSMKFGLVARLKVGDIYEKAKIFQSLQFNDWLENEKQRLSHLRDRASETGRRKELRECVEKLQLLNTPEERARKINEVPEVHVDPRMAPDYESADEQYYKKAADWTINRSRSEQLFPERKGAKSNSMDNDTQKSLDASVHMSRLPMEDMANRSGTVINLKSTAVETASLPSSGAVLSDTEPEKVWHYKDPSGNVQGPFTLLQLSKWESFFPRDIRIWLTFESEKNSLLLTEVLKQQKDFILPSAVETKDMSIGTGTGQDRTNSCLVANNSSSPVGCNVNHLSGLSSHSAEFSGLTKEGSTLLCGTLPSKSTKDVHNSHGQVQHQVNYSCTIPSSTASGSHDERVPREQVGEWKNPQDIVGMWSSTAPSMNCSLKSNVEPHPHPDGYSVKDKFQNGSKGNLPAGSVQSFNSQIDSDLQKVPDLTLQQSHRDPAASLSTKSPSEFMCKEEDTCCHSATNDGTHDDLQLSIGLAKHESSSLTNPVEDRDSSSASACRPQQIVYMSTTDSPKTATINWHNTSLTDASCKPFDQHSVLNNDPVFSSGIHQDREHPSPTAKLERKQTSMNQSELISVAPKDSGTKTCVHSSISFVSESSPPAGKTGSLPSLDLTSCLVERHSSDRDTTAQKEQLNEGNMSLKRKNLVVNPISDAQVIAVSDVFESLTEKICEKNNLHGAVSSEGLMPASTEEEQPQCSSPIALSPWGEQNYYQGEAVDSALWGVQDDHENDMWSMHSPTPAIQPSSGLGADGKDVSGVIDDVMAAHENSTCVETLLKQGEKKMEQGNSSAFTGSGELEQVKTKPVSASGPGPSIHVTTKTADCQLSGTALEGSAKASGWKPPGLLLEEITKASDWQSSDICKESGSKASCLQPSDSSLGRGVKASAWEESNYSTEEGTRASGWQRSSSFPEGSRKGSCWQLSGSAEGNVKASGQQQSSLSPEGSRKGSCWQPSGSAEGNMKASGQQQSSLSPEESRKVSGLQRSDSSAQGNTNASSWQPSGSSAERNAKVDGWQRTSSSPERCRKASGRHPSVRESSRANSTNEDHKSSSCHQASRPTAKNTWETPKRQGNSDKNTVIWGEALGNNRSWNPSSGNASQRSHGGYNHERYSHGSDSRRGSSNHSRRFDHRQDHDRGGGSSRWSRGQGQSPRSVCKYYESGRCYKGDKCHYLHR